MLKTSVIVVIVIVALFVIWYNYSALLNRTRSACALGRACTENFYDGDVKTLELVQGDPVLRDIYRQIHNLEAMTRIEVAQNNNFPGGNDGSPRERMIMENIALEIARLKDLANKFIAENRMPYVRRDLPPIGGDFDNCYYGNCQYKLDLQEKILGIPSVPGVIHPYYNQRRPFETSRLPKEYLDNMSMV